MIQLSGLTKRFGDRVLLDGVNWQVNAGDRVGLTGPNGAGKTTLLRMLAGLDEPDVGQVIRPANATIGYLPQDGLEHSGRSLRDEVSQAFGPLLEARAEIARIEQALADPALPDGEHEGLLVRYHDVTDLFQREEGHTIDLRVTQVLEGLGFRQDQFDQPAETFSGGWQMRIALARLLLSRPTLMLLDEPTNHLDLDARNWLESFLCGYPHVVILVSHDRYFLDAVVNRIVDISMRTLTEYPGNYSQFIAERDARLDRLRQAKQDQDEEIARHKAFIDRFRYQATKASQVQSRIKMLDKIVPIDVPPERRRVHFTFPACPKSGRLVIELEGVRKAYGSNVVLDDVSLHVERGDRIALVAPNGAGKSTLMRILSGEEAPDHGERSEGHQLVMQYFAQDEANRLKPKRTVYETMEADSPVSMVPMIRNILGGFLFSGDDIHKRAGVLSGGERTRLAVARMLLKPANTLLLDEPTNHLDLDSKDVLLEALEDFGGTLIFVSHDRYFVDRLATKIIAVGDGEIEMYPGTYQQFLWSRTVRNETAAPAPPTEAASPPPEGRRTRSGRSTRPAAEGHEKAVSGPDSWAEKKKADAESRRLKREADARRKRLADLENRIAEREAAIKKLEDQMAQPGFYDDRDRSGEVTGKHQDLMWEVGNLMEQWEALQAEELAESSK